MASSLSLVLKLTKDDRMPGTNNIIRVQACSDWFLAFVYRIFSRWLHQIQWATVVHPQEITEYGHLHAHLYLRQIQECTLFVNNCSCINHPNLLVYFLLWANTPEIKHIRSIYLCGCIHYSHYYSQFSSALHHIHVYNVTNSDGETVIDPGALEWMGYQIAISPKIQ